MIYINIDKIDVKTVTNQSGIFTGNNFAPNWSYFSKSNTNVSGNHVSDTVNILIDDDGYDFTVSDNDDAKQTNNYDDDIVINKKKNVGKQKKSKLQRHEKSKANHHRKSTKSSSCKRVK